MSGERSRPFPERFIVCIRRQPRQLQRRSVILARMVNVFLRCMRGIFVGESARVYSAPCATLVRKRSSSRYRNSFDNHSVG
jgi:hypothetical protein